MTDIILKAEEFIREQFKAVDIGHLSYHSIHHSIDVVDSVREFISGMNISNEEEEILILAAWFHDIGYLYDYEEHEKKSAEISKTFLENNGYPREKTAKVINLIMATRMPQSPKDRNEEILCDADLSHAGKKGFYSRSLLLRDEWEKNRKVKISDEEWIKKNIIFLQSVNYFTAPARQKFSKQKNKNLEKLKKRLNEMQSDDHTIQPPGLTPEPGKKDKQVDRGIETMFRNTMRTHVEFSIMADNKANIMISVNTLILTAVVAVMSRKLDSNPHLIIPTALLTFISLATLIFATLVTRPKITSGIFSEEEIRQKKANLLFFGNFFNMDLKMFEWGMNEMMRDKEYLYGSMIKDFYYLGQVLGQKYKYLRICYSLFMYGIIITVIAFTIAVYLAPEGTTLGPLIE